MNLSSFWLNTYAEKKDLIRTSTANKVHRYVVSIGPLFTKRKGVLPQDLGKSRSREIGCYNERIALKFDRHLPSAAAERLEKSKTESYGFETSRDLTAREALMCWRCVTQVRKHMMSFGIITWRVILYKSFMIPRKWISWRNLLLSFIQDTVGFLGYNPHENLKKMHYSNCVSYLNYLHTIYVSLFNFIFLNSGKSSLTDTDGISNWYYLERKFF